MPWSVSTRPDLLLARLNSDHVARVALLDVAKENFATRPAIVMEPLDRLVYQALVDRDSVKLVGDVHPWVFVGRLKRKDPARGVYPRRREWENYRERQQLLVLRYRNVLKTDIVEDVSFVVELRDGPGVGQTVGWISVSWSERETGRVRERMEAAFGGLL
jgi:hypothetical protein